LEGTALPVEEVARLAGFGSAANLRLHFGRRHNKRLYRKRCRIENAFARLRNWRAIAMRYTRRGDLFLSAIALAAAVIFWLRW
jgi:transposase